MNGKTRRILRQDAQALQVIGARMAELIDELDTLRRDASVAPYDAVTYGLMAAARVIRRAAAKTKSERTCRLLEALEYAIDDIDPLPVIARARKETTRTRREDDQITERQVKGVKP